MDAVSGTDRGEWEGGEARPSYLKPPTFGMGVAPKTIQVLPQKLPIRFILGAEVIRYCRIRDTPSPAPA
jgi:hypothetical protein